MNKLLLIIISIIAIGFFIGLIFPKYDACTEMACHCENASEEIPCNTCYKTDYVFTTGILNVIKSCKGKEMITCGSEVTNRRIYYNNEECRIDFYILGFNLKYSSSNQQDTVSNN